MYHPKNANKMTLFRATGKLDGYTCAGDYYLYMLDARAEAKEHGWKLKDIETHRIKDVKAVLLHLLNS